MRAGGLRLCLGGSYDGHWYHVDRDTMAHLGAIEPSLRVVKPDWTEIDVRDDNGKWKPARVCNTFDWSKLIHCSW